MVKFGKRLCELSPISRWNPGRNSLTIQLQLGIPRPGWSPKLGKFGGLGWRGKEVTHTSPSVMQISVWPVIRSQPRGGCLQPRRTVITQTGRPTHTSSRRLVLPPPRFLQLLLRTKKLRFFADNDKNFKNRAKTALKTGLCTYRHSLATV